MSLRSRLGRRWRTIRAFAAQGLHPGDRLKLAVAGLARHRPFGDQSLYARGGRLLAGRVSPRVRLAGGARVDLTLDELADLMVFEEIFIEQIYPLDEIPFTPDLVIDAGAYTGMFTLLAHGRYPCATFVAIEPLPANYEILQRHLATNAIDAQTYRAAIATTTGTVSFVGAGFGGHVDLASSSGAISVPAFTIPDLLARFPSERLLLKMDIEGMERDVLPAIAGIPPPTAAILLETHYPETTCMRFLEPLLATGFSHRIIRRRDAEPPIEAYVERLLLRTPERGGTPVSSRHG
ncbi:MAG TPA: FkbM family methyltransferase [Opitutaceae bacterium]|nr:FkbM family methyltransferase [Opitutaceae bacterium]